MQGIKERGPGEWGIVNLRQVLEKVPTADGLTQDPLDAQVSKADVIENALGSNPPQVTGKEGLEWGQELVEEERIRIGRDPRDGSGAV